MRKLQAAESGTPGVPGGIPGFQAHQLVPGVSVPCLCSQAQVHQGGGGGWGSPGLPRYFALCIWVFSILFSGVMLVAGVSETSVLQLPRRKSC